MKDNLRRLNIQKIFNLGKYERQVIFVAALVVFIVTNVLISSLSLRLDLSQGKAYSLSPATRKIVRRLDDIVTITFFVSSDLPTRFLPLKTEVTDMLNEYKREGGNKITLKIVDPKKDQQSQEDALSAGIPELQFSQMEQDKFAISTAYFGIGLNYSSKQETIPQVNDIGNLEYSLTSSIYKMTRKEAVRIGLTGENISPQNPQGNVGALKQVLGQQFTVGNVTISTQSGSLDTSYKTVILIDDNSRSYSGPEIDVIRKYLASGGKAIFFVDGVWVQDNLTTLPADHGLFGLLNEYGITLEKKLALSASAELVNFGGSDFVSILTPYPFWIRAGEFNSKTPYFPNIRQLTFPWTSPLILSSKAGYEITPLVRTSPRSWEQSEPFELNPQAIPPPNNGDLKEMIIAAQSKSQRGGQIVVIPSSRAVQDRYLGRNASNIEFILNVVNELASGGALSGIRSRSVNLVPLPALNDSQKDIFKYANILALPALFALFGFYRMIQRKK